MRTAILFALMLSACVPLPQQEAVNRAAPPFPVMTFFEGRTQGEGRLKILFRSAQAIRVESQSRQLADGTLLVEQRIQQQGKPLRTREWRIREVAPGHYAGALSDAAGPVSGTAEGGRLHLRFAMKGGLQADQWLTLAKDGRSAHNVMAVRKFGITVATLDETIRRQD